MFFLPQTFTKSSRCIQKQLTPHRNARVVFSNFQPDNILIYLPSIQPPVKLCVITAQSLLFISVWLPAVYFNAALLIMKTISWKHFSIHLSHRCLAFSKRKQYKIVLHQLYDCRGNVFFLYAVFRSDCVLHFTILNLLLWMFVRISILLHPELHFSQENFISGYLFPALSLSELTRKGRFMTQRDTV